ncbi:MAG: sugar-binding domain-containing protein, partial [Oscillospiraceae bacterium]
YRISDELRFIDPKHEMTFVPLVGNSGLYNRYLQTSSIANRFAEKYASRCFYPNVSFDRSQSSKLTPFERASIDELSSLWNHIDTAIFSLSSASSVDNYYLSEFSDSLSPSSVHLSACGEIFSQAYFADGSTESFVEEYPITAFPLEKLRQIKNTICIAVGPSKAYSIIWALRCGFVNTLITDVPTAEAIQIILDEET